MKRKQTSILHINSPVKKDCVLGLIKTTVKVVLEHTCFQAVNYVDKKNRFQPSSKHKKKRNKKQYSIKQWSELTKKWQTN
jgi:hypothetical protein